MAHPRIKFCICAGFCVLASQGAFAFDLGVNTHFGKGMGDPSVAQAWLQRAGVNAVRDELYWYDVEREPGKFALAGRASQAVATYKVLAAKGIHVSLLLGYGNSLYDGGSQPATPEGRAAFSRYAAWAVEQTRDFVYAYEVWNEWNLGSGTRPKVRQGDPDGYARLVGATVPSVRSMATARPVKVVAGGLGDDIGDWPWARGASRAGAFRDADVVSVHLYNYSVPMRRAGAEELLERARSFVDVIPRGKSVWINEVGWPTHTGRFGLKEDEAAREMSKFLVGVRSVPAVSGVWIYELFDSGTDDSEREHRFGMLRQDGTEKPAGCRLRSLGADVRDAEFVRRIEQRDVVAYVLRTSGGYLVGAWPKRGAAADGAVVDIEASPSDVESLGGGCRDGLDNVQVQRGAGGVLSLSAEVSDAPLLFRVKAQKLPSLVIHAAN